MRIKPLCDDEIRLQVYLAFISAYLCMPHPQFHTDMSSWWHEETVVPFVIWRAGKRLFARGWYVSVTLWRLFAVTASIAADTLIMLQISGERRESWQNRDCLTLLFAFVSSLFFTNKGFLINWKGPLPQPGEPMKGSTEVWHNVAAQKEAAHQKITKVQVKDKAPVRD